MEVARLDRETRLRKEKSGRAVALALEGKWEAAAALNRELLDLFPDDVEALNRLGKAYLELGRYSQARGAFAGALAVSPHNTIAKKNLERLAHLEDKAAPPVASHKVAPSLFIEESCKSGVTVLQRRAPGHVLAKMAAGDPVSLRCEERRLMVDNLQGECLGEVEPKLAARLLRLIRQGNQYAGAVVSIDRQDVTVTLREVYTHPSLSGVCSFPARGSDQPATYLRSPYLNVDLGGEAEEEDLALEWTDPDEAGEEGSPRPERALEPTGYEDDEEVEE